MRKILIMMAVLAFLTMGALAGCDKAEEPAPAPAPAANATQGS